MPDWKPAIRERLAGLSLEPAREAAIIEEISQHLDDRFAELLSRGATGEEAGRLAIDELSDGELLARELGPAGPRESPEPLVWAGAKGHWLGNPTQDLRHTARMLAKSPVFTAVAVLSLALGIGATTAVFSLANAILSSLPVPNPQDLRILEWSGSDVSRFPTTGPRYGDGHGRIRGPKFSQPVFQALRQQCADEADIFAYAEVPGGATARARREAVKAPGLMVSDNFFSGLGARPLIGRLLGAADEAAGAAPSIVISYRWWEREFDLDPGALGQPVVLNGQSFTVAGVLPPGFPGVRTGAGTEFYVPLSALPRLVPDWRQSLPGLWCAGLMARLKPGVSEGRFQATLDVAFAREAETEMKQPKVSLADGRSGAESRRFQNYYRKPLLLLFVAVGAILLVACANLAGLQLARGAARQHEFAVRAALGASRARLIRQSLTESAALALLGTGLGMVFALWAETALSQLLAGSPDGLSYDLSLNRAVLGFTLAITIVTALLAGLLPALRAAGADPAAGLKGRAALGSYRLRAGRFLVAAQIALSLLLLSGAGLYVRTVANLTLVNPGFAVEDLLIFLLNPADAGYKEERLAAYYDRVLQSLAAIPGVRSAALLQYQPFGGGYANYSFTLPGHDPGMARGTIVSEAFFTTLGLPALRGRELRAADAAGAPKVVVVNATFARQFLRDENPVGRTMKLANYGSAEWQIVGVCPDIKSNLKEEPPPTIYFSFRQTATGYAFFALRTALPLSGVAGAARRSVAAIDPDVPVTDLATEAQMRNKSIRQERMFAAVCGSLAVMAALLSCLGLHGLMAYQVARGAPEIGLRMALGATRGQIAASILREALLLAGAGLAVGLPLTLALTRLLRASLFGVAPADPLALGVAVVVLLAVGLAAAWLPTLRAARVDPMMALRHE